MTGSRTTSAYVSPSLGLSLIAKLLGAVAFCWTIAGETSNPQLATRDLPSEVLNQCATADCTDDAEYRSHWVGRTAQGSLFVVGRAGCAPSRCSYWLVEKGAAAARTLLELDGSFTLHRTAGRYPVIDVRTRSDDDGITHLRFEWNGEAYARTAKDRIYEVNGVECGTRDECDQVAQRALKAQKVDRALRIWQQVHGISWI